MEHAAHDQHVRGRQGFYEEVAGIETQAMAEVPLADVLFEHGAHLRQIETSSPNVRVSLRDLDRKAPFGRTNIDERLVSVPWKFLGDCLGSKDGAPRHSFDESAERCRVVIQPCEVIACARAALRLTSFQRGG